MNRIIYKSLAIVTIALTLTACAGRKAYERPQAIDEKLFRTESPATDA